MWTVSGICQYINYYDQHCDRNILVVHLVSQEQHLSPKHGASTVEFSSSNDKSWQHSITQGTSSDQTVCSSVNNDNISFSTLNWV